MFTRVKYSGGYMRAQKPSVFWAALALLLAAGIATMLSGRDIDWQDAQLANAIAAAKPPIASLSALPKALFESAQAVIQATGEQPPLYALVASLWAWFIGEQAIVFRLPVIWAMLLGLAVVIRYRPPKWLMWGAAVSAPLLLIGLVDSQTGFFLAVAAWSTGAFSLFCHKRTVRRALLYLLAVVVMLASNGAAIFVMIAHVIIYRSNLVLRKQLLPWAWRLGGVLLGGAALMGLLLNFPTNALQSHIRDMMAVRYPLEPALLFYHQQPQMLYYDRLLNFRRGIAVNVNWRDHSAEELDAILARVSQRGIIWVIMVEGDRQGQYLYDKLSTEWAIGYRAVADGVIFARFDDMKEE